MFNLIYTILYTSYSFCVIYPSENKWKSDFRLLNQQTEKVCIRLFHLDMNPISAMNGQ